MNTNKVSGLLSCLLITLSFNQSVSAQTLDSAESPIDEILITATKLPRKSEDIAGTVTVISEEEIAQYIGNDLADIARYQPGLSMNTAARGGNQGYTIRGIGGNRVLMLIDGVRSSDIYAAGPASYGKDAFEVDDLKAVEIIRGPASVLYGADAMGGAVILHTKDPQDYISDTSSQYLGLRTSASSADEQYKIGLTGALQSEVFGTVIQFTNRQYRESDTNNDVERNPLDGAINNILLKGVWAPNPQHRIELGIDASLEETEYQLLNELSSTVTASVGTDQTDRYRISGHHLWQSDIALADSIDTQVYLQTTDALQHTEQLRTSYSFINPTDFTTFGGTQAERSTDFRFNQETFGLGSSLTKVFSTGNIDHSMVYGFNYEQTNTERPRNRCETAILTGTATCDIAAYPFAPPESFPNKTFPDTETLRSGVYWQDEIIIGASRLALVPGIRYDHYQMKVSTEGLQDLSSFGYQVSDFDENEVSINFGAIYDLTDDIALFAQYAEGFRPPNFDESNQAFVNLGFGYATVPNPSLTPETSKGFELGIKSRFDRSNFNLALFSNDYKNFIETSFVGSSGGISLFQDQNIAEVHIRGAEFDSEYQINDRWSLRGSVAYAEGENKITDTALDSIEPLTAVLGLSYSPINNQWSLETLITLVDKKDQVSSVDVVTAESYSVIDMVGHYNFSERASVRFGLFNLTNEKYAQWANVQGLAVDAFDDIARSMASGTNIRASLSLSF